MNADQSCMKRSWLWAVRWSVGDSCNLILLGALRVPNKMNQVVVASRKTAMLWKSGRSSTWRSHSLMTSCGRSSNHSYRRRGCADFAILGVSRLIIGRRWPASCSSWRPALAGKTYPRRWVVAAAWAVGAACGTGKRRESGNGCMKSYWPNSRQPTKLIGRERSWIVPHSAR